MVISLELPEVLAGERVPVSPEAGPPKLLAVSGTADTGVLSIVLIMALWTGGLLPPINVLAAEEVRKGA